MAQKKSKKDDSSAGGILVLVLFIILCIVVVVITLTPIIIVLGITIYWFKYNKTKKIINGNMSDFWLNAKEKEDFEYVSIKLSDAIRQIDNAKKIGENEGLTRNKDGSFSGRSNRGKQIRGAISEGISIRDENFPYYDELSYLPLNRWKKFRNSYRLYYSFLISGLFWFILTFILAITYYNSIGEGISALISFPGDFFTTILDEGITKYFSHLKTQHQWEILGISTTSFVLMFFLIFLVCTFTVKKVTPKPDEVNLDNFNKY